MKTKILHLVLAFCFLGSLPVKTVALNYTIAFTGRGASTTVNSVIVQNLMKGTSVTVPAGNVLNLVDIPTAVEALSASDESIRVYTASLDGKSRVSFFTRQAGSTQLNAFSTDGRKAAGISTDLQAGVNTFELSLPKGIFVIQVIGNGYAYTARMLNQTGTQKSPGIVFTGTAKPASSSPQKSKNSTFGITTMTYTAGDRLLYKGISGIYSTIVTDVPTGSKTTNFEFYPCTDGDGNNYAVVKIGQQIWMAENLKTTQYNAPYNGSTTIPLVPDSLEWVNKTTPGYCWYKNDAATYKNKYGALYNWYTINTGKLAPTGWRVASVDDWKVLFDYLTANGYNYDGSTTDQKFAKSLATTTEWALYTHEVGTIGNDLSKNNSTGFSAFPSGYRYPTGFQGEFYQSYLWTSTEFDPASGASKELHFDHNYVKPFLGYKYYGFSVRCVRN
jgi:uncharacterized protein (TIGR02145 family)